MQHQDKWGRVALFTAALIWGSSFFVMKNAVSGVPVFMLLAFRFTVGCALLSLVFMRRLKTCTRKVLGHGAIIGVLLYLSYSLQTFGLAETTPGKNAFLTAVYCVLVPFASWAVYRKRPNRWNWIAAVGCITGIGLVSLDGELTIGRGDALTLLSGVGYTFQVMAVSHYGEKDDPVLLTIVQFGTAAALSLVSSALTETMPASLPAGALAELIYLAVFATSIAILLQSVGQSVTPAAPAAILLSLESVFGVLFSVIFYHETVTPRLGIGFALIFLAVIASETQFTFLRPKRAQNIKTP